MALKRRSLVLVAVASSAVAIATLAAGTIALATMGGHGDTPQWSGPEPALGTIPVITDWQQITLPLDAYVESNTKRDVVLRAQYAATAACMQRFGLALDAPRWDGAAAASPVDGPTHYRLFGLLDLEHAKTSGYRSPGLPPAEVPGDIEAPHPPAYPDVFAGKLGGGTYNGQQIPDGGCIAEARQAVAGGTPPDDALPEALSGDAWRLSNADSRVIVAFHRWSACMARAGYTYATPMDANNDPHFSGSTASDEEIAVATADVTCKLSTNLTGIRMAVDAAYQQAMVATHATELRTLQAALDREYANALDMPAGP